MSTSFASPWRIRALVELTNSSSDPIRIGSGNTIEAALCQLQNEGLLVSQGAGRRRYERVLRELRPRGRPQERVVRQQRRSVSVIAGNYPSVDDPIAQKTLAYIKAYRPRSWRDDARYRSTPGRPGPLSGAFLTINPLLTPDEVAERTHDPLLVRLNADEPFSVLSIQGKYSLVVASFYGKTITTLPDGRATGDVRRFEETLGQTLDEAARQARALVRLLRTGRYRSSDTFGDLGQPDFVGQPIEAYVFHDRFQSVVTVGSFDSPDDPRIRQLYEKFRAKVRKHAQTGQDVLTAEFVRSLGDPRRKIPPETFLFDPQPQLMKVPRL